MASPGQRRRTCGYTMALFDSHTKCMRGREKEVGTDPCVEKKPCEICDGFTSEQKKQLATPTYRARKEHQKKASSPLLVDPGSVTVLGQVESGKGESSDRGEVTPSKKKTFHKSPKKTSKASEYQSDLKSLDDKWSERFARLEALFLAKTFQVPVEPDQSPSVVVSDKPIIPPEQQFSSQTSTTGATGQMMKATQPFEAPGALTSTRPFEAPCVTAEVQPTSQDVPYDFAVSGPEVQPPGPASQSTATTKNRSLSLTGVVAPSDEPVSDEERLSDHVSPSLAEEGEL